jgi:fatty-acid peroxygenase
MADLDQSLPLLIKGYAWLPDLRRRTPGRPVQTRLMGRPAVVVEGPAAAAFFAASGHLERRTALPPTVANTLFGRGAVHTLDGAAHRARKAMFVSLLMGDGVDTLAKQAGEAFDEAAAGWRGGPAVSLFDETAKVIAGTVTRWAGVPVDDREVPALAADLVAMVDGFATAGPRMWRALRARGRRERWLARRHEQKPLIVGADLDPHTAAVELLNIIRPSTAVTWLVTFAAHALDRWPEHAARLRMDDDRYTRAFVHEVRRFYPFAPFLGGRAVRDLIFDGVEIPAGTLVLLDVYGQNHDPELWPDPYAFRPERFLDREIGAFDLIPQGGGDPRTGHRCPGELITVALLGTLARRLAELDYYLPPQDLTIDLSRIPAKPADGVRIVVPQVPLSASRSPRSGGS